MYCVIFVFTIAKQVDQQSVGEGFGAKYHIINYSAELARCNFSYLLMNGKRFQTMHEIKKNGVKELMLIRKDNFVDCFEK